MTPHDHQEAEYRLPVHWLLGKHALIAYLRKTELMAEMIRAAGTPHGRALDVGCGDGRGTFEISRLLGPDLVFEGIDFSARAIAFAKLMAPELGFSVQDTNALPYEARTFSLVVAREVIEHIPIPELPAAMAELARVLAPGGLLLITTPSKRRRLPPKHFQHFTADELHALLRAAGLAPIASRGFGWWPSPRLERGYRYLIGLPSLWRIHAAVGTHELPVDRADDLLVLGRA